MPAPAVAQQWDFTVGGAGRIDFTDNYQLRAFDPYSATTFTVSPFVVGYRRTETSQLNLLAGIGYNYVVSSEAGNDDYWSGRLNFNGSASHERHSFGFNLGVVRDQTLVTETQQTGVNFGTGATRTGSTAGVNYGYVLTERTNLGLFGSLYRNSYDQVQATSNIQDNSGWSVGTNLGYAWTQDTQFTLGVSYASFDSNRTDSDSVSTTLAVAHQFSERLSASAYGGYFWSKINASQSFLVCPTTPVFCDLGLVAPVPVALGTERDEGGTLFGGTINYRYSEQTTFRANASQNLAPSGVGTVTKVTGIGASVLHSFSERLRGTVFASWTESTIPGTNTSTLYSRFTSYGASASYDLSQAWLLTVGIRHDESNQRGLSADGNTLFVAVAYNWPGPAISDFGGWLGSATFPNASPGAGTPPEAVPGQPLGAPAPIPRSEPASESTGSNP